MRYRRVSDLELDIAGYELDQRERETSSGFTRVTTVVSLRGGGETGRGEDVSYDADAHEALQESASDFPVSGEYTFDEFSEQLSEIDLFPSDEPTQSIFRNYRQWAFESAALDLALKQADTNLADCLGRTYDPVRFVVSTRLADPPTGNRVLDWLDRDPDLEFKLDPTSDWTPAVVERLAATEAVRILDLKGQYHGTTVDQPADPELYERIIETFPEALIEDPELSEETRPLFEGQETRVTWDYPIRSVETVEALPWEPDWLNIKPSRFGSVQSLFETIEYCRDHEIRMFGGGQFELDVGREHLHAIASLCYPDAPNDVAPPAYNDPDPTGELPSSPLAPPEASRGLRWREDTDSHHCSQAGGRSATNHSLDDAGGTRTRHRLPLEHSRNCNGPGPQTAGSFVSGPERPADEVTVNRTPNDRYPTLVPDVGAAISDDRSERGGPRRVRYSSAARECWATRSTSGTIDEDGWPRHS